MMEVAFIVHCFSSGQQLKKHDPKAVDIRLLGETGSTCIFGINVTNGTHYVSRSMGLGEAQAFRDAKVCKMSLEFLVQQYVG